MREGVLEHFSRKIGGRGAYLVPKSKHYRICILKNMGMVKTKPHSIVGVVPLGVLAKRLEITTAPPVVRKVNIVGSQDRSNITFWVEE